MESNIRFMRRAIELAVENVKSEKGGPFGAVIAKDGQVIAEGANCVTSHNDPTAHAEIEAIRKASRVLNNFDLSGCVIYASAEPCPMCLSAIYWARISRIYFGSSKIDAAAINFDDAFIYEEIPKSLEKRAIPSHQILQEEAQRAFKEWSNSTSKIPY